MSSQIQDIQEGLFEFFEDIDDKMVIDFIDSFVYFNSTQDVRVSKLIERFLKENELMGAYMNVIHDRDNQSNHFLRASLSERSMIQEIQSCLLSLAYNRFRNQLAKAKAKSSPLVKLTRSEKDDLNMVIGHCERSNSDLMCDEDITRDMFDKEEADELIDERKRLSKLFTKVLKIIK